MGDGAVLCGPGMPVHTLRLAVGYFVWMKWGVFTRERGCERMHGVVNRAKKRARWVALQAGQQDPVRDVMGARANRGHVGSVAHERGPMPGRVWCERQRASALGKPLAIERSGMDSWKYRLTVAVEWYQNTCNVFSSSFVIIISLLCWKQKGIKRKNV
ncbi:hypothetical protein KDAU_74320 [Dictyobacter aurantiacus]|uniref:Uncharacterized protein n=1 Tax=Dictyobacter aurantiacus TaxID=1936993 RepID=A0A401ZTA4_9CHLR|nr:hypothetical protein KDAU_74320 [Dictyobacter aurantiacus]